MDKANVEIGTTKKRDFQERRVIDGEVQSEKISG